MTRWVVDGMNVIGSRPDGWWRDRPAAMRRLVGQLEALGDPVAVIFDGAEADVRSKRVEIVFATRRGRNAADDDIVRRVASDPDPSSLTVVTSDAELARRVREHGAEVEGAGSFLRRLA